MSLESDLFAKLRPDFTKLTACGFHKDQDGYTYTRLFQDGKFRAVIHVDPDGCVSGHVYDTDFNDEYLPIHVPGNTTPYNQKIRSSYLAILEQIGRDAFYPVPFSNDQANHLCESIEQFYGDKPDLSITGQAVFCNPDSGQSYARIREQSSLEENSSGSQACYLYVRGQLPRPVPSGFQLSQERKYHHWLIIRLNDQMPKAELMEWIHRSHIATLGSGNNGPLAPHDWVIPANLKYYNIVGEFARHSEVYWKQSPGMQEGDILYLYITAPFSCILYRCRIEQTQLPRKDGGKMAYLMKIRRLRQYGPNEFTRNKLIRYGLRGVRGARRIPLRLKEVFDQYEQQHIQ